MGISIVHSCPIKALGKTIYHILSRIAELKEPMKYGFSPIHWNVIWTNPPCLLKLQQITKIIQKSTIWLVFCIFFMSRFYVMYCDVMFLVVCSGTASWVVTLPKICTDRTSNEQGIPRCWSNSPTFHLSRYLLLTGVNQTPKTPMLT